MRKALVTLLVAFGILVGPSALCIDGTGYRFGARADDAVTGSIKKRVPTFRTPRGRDEVYDGLPRAVPGED